MKIQKTWVGYIVWGLFSIVLFSNIGFSALKLVENGTSTFSPLVTIAMSFAIVIGGSALLCVLYHLFMKYLYDKIFTEPQEASGEKNIIEIILFVFVIFTAILIRSIVLVAIGGEYTGDDTYYRLSMGVLTHSAAGLTTNGTYIYSELLNLIFGILGKKFMAGLIVQCILQIGIIIFAFFGVKRAFGKFSAWVTLFALAFMPGNFMAVNTMNPALFFLFFFALFFWILTLSVSENYVKPSNQFIHCCSYVVLGLISAFLCFYDISGFISVVIAIIFLLHKEKKEDVEYTFEQKSSTRIFLYLVAFLLCLFMLLFFVSPNGTIGFNAIKEFAYQFVPNNGFDFYLITPSALYWDGLIPLFLGAIWFYSYPKSDSANGIPFALAIIVLFAFSILKYDVYSYDLLNNLLWAVLSGIGFRTIVLFGANQEEQEMAKKERQSRKVQKELKRSFEAGEKSIQLNNLDPLKVDPPAPRLESDESPRSYGIGRKEDIPMPSQVPPVSTALPEDHNKEKEAESAPAVTPAASVPAKAKVAQVPVLPKDIIPAQPPKSNMNMIQSNNNTTQVNQVPSDNITEKKVEDNAIVQNTVVKQNAPMRRGYRTPSKSTFSPEELERIRQHTNGEFAYHSKEEMMQTGSGTKQETILKNNFIHVIPDSREEDAAKTNEVLKESSSPYIAPSAPDVSKAENAVSQSAEQIPANQQPVPSLPPLVKDKFTEEKPKLIKNPLPGPKPHVSRELSYDYIPKETEMDYDLKDMSGKDYYDV